MGKIRVDYTGEKIGFLDVIEPTDKRDAQNCIIWKCKCNMCGEYTEIAGSVLRKRRENQACSHCMRVQGGKKMHEKYDEKIEGKRIGKLIVIREATEEEHPRDKNKNRYYLCQCDCGNTTYVRYTSLKNETTKSCGCYVADVRKKNIIDMTGQRFGNLIALEPTDKRAVNGSVIWKCKCDCGNICEAPRIGLLQGDNVSCGCKKSKGEGAISRLLNEANIPFKTQYYDKTFGEEYNSTCFFDFFVDNKYMIEYDGQQHFTAKGGRGWCTEELVEAVKKRDARKNEWCKNHNVPLIRIPYTHYDDLCLDDLKLETTKFRVV